MQEASLLDMLKSGVHFGHQQRRWHPKMKPFIYTSRSGVNIIDLEQTALKLREACDFLASMVSRGGVILFVGSKRQAQPIVKRAALETGMPYVTERWIGGTMTNFENISKRIHRLKDLRSQRDRGELEKYTKHEQLKFDEEIKELEELIGGIETLNQLPAAMFVVDVRREKTAIREARKKKVPIVAMVDTNCNPEMIDYPIPANDDATKSIKLIVDIVAQSIKAAKASITPAPAAQKPEPAAVLEPNPTEK
ncbi:MAG: 30S ribosomal protein S2 [Patescibacteria group bacterium]|nr:30S ribosomal protein S2 [Patescibacteria group bacterium]MDD5716064.1 30S ribosomal protein S2 [Patescibacteria group bacterium]